MEDNQFPKLSVYQIEPDLWRFNENAGDMTSVDAYLVIGRKRAALIDTLQSDLPRSLVNVVREITDLPVDVLITHGHPDHAGAEAAKLAAADGFTLYMNHTDIPIARNMYAPWFSEDIFADITEGDRYDLGGITLKAYRVAGHTPGSMVFLDREKRRCFTGDAFGVWLQLDHSLPMSDYVEELIRFEAALADVPDAKLWIGHAMQAPAGFFTAGYVTQMREACEKIIKGELSGQAVEIPPQMKETPMAILMKDAKIAQYQDVKFLTYRDDKLLR